MGIKIIGYIFFLICLVFGGASSPKIFNEFAELVLLIIIINWPNYFIIRKTILSTHYLDDYTGVSRDDDLVKYQGVLVPAYEAQFQVFQHELTRLGIPTQSKKTVPPTRTGE